MRTSRENFRKIIGALLSEGTINCGMGILVVCGGDLDRDVLVDAGFKNCLITNLDRDEESDSLAPFKCKFENAESLTFPDDHFDVVIVHAGLHHCYSPHRAIAEMYRVAKTGILFVEPHDNIFTRIGLYFGFGQEYEVAAVFDHDLECGGVVNSSIPNYIYRFNRKEILKVVRCLVPYARPRVRFFYMLTVPFAQLELRKSGCKLFLVKSVAALLEFLNSLFPSTFSNNIGAFIKCPNLNDDLMPWISRVDDQIRPNPAWFEADFKKNSK